MHTVLHKRYLLTYFKELEYHTRLSDASFIQRNSKDLILISLSGKNNKVINFFWMWNTEARSFSVQ